MTLTQSIHEPSIKSTRSRRPRPHGGPFFASSFEASLRFLLWLETRRILPTAQDVMDYFGVSRATAYRWMTFICDAKHIDRIQPGIYRNNAFLPVELPARTRPRPAWLQQSMSGAVQPQ